MSDEPDIVERVRIYAALLSEGGPSEREAAALQMDAAAEIERLREVVARGVILTRREGRRAYSTHAEREWLADAVGALPGSERLHDPAEARARKSPGSEQWGDEK